MTAERRCERVVERSMTRGPLVCGALIVEGPCRYEGLYQPCDRQRKHPVHGVSNYSQHVYDGLSCARGHPVAAEVVA